MGMAGINTGKQAENKIRTMFKKAQQMKPQIIVANLG